MPVEVAIPIPQAIILTMTELTGVLLNPERVTQYAWMRFFPEDDIQVPFPGGQTLVQLHDGITVTVAGFTTKAGQRIDDAVWDMFLDEMSRWSSSLPRSNAAQSLPLSTGAAGPLALSLLPYRHRQAAAAGPISFRYETRGQQAFTRYLHRTVTCHTAERAALLEQRLQCGPCAVMGTDYQGKPCNGINSYEPVIVVPKRNNLRLNRGR